MRNNLFLLFFTSVFILGASFFGCDTEATTQRVEEGSLGDQEVRYVTLDGYDPASDTIIEPINIWKDYKKRSKGIVGKGKHGERVQFLEREGDGVKVKLKNGKSGWVTYYFIKEFK